MNRYTKRGLLNKTTKLIFYWDVGGIFLDNHRIERISKNQCESILTKFHYLSKQGFKFRVGFNYGLFLNDRLIGVAIYTCPSVPETVKSCFGLNSQEQDGIFELGRLALDPECYQKNLTSWFLSRTIKLLKVDTKVRAILTYADSDFHTGYTYQATNFIYYGLTTFKKDFYILQTDGSYIKHQRGKVKGIQGEWKPRSRKHRYLMIFDKNLKCLWKQEKYPKIDNIAIYNNNIKDKVAI